jgi:hypothetical protein
MKRKSIIIHTLATLALAALVNSAYAQDAKTFSGVECQPQFPDLAANYYNTFFGVQNVGTDTLWLTCPVVRDNVTNTNGTSAFKMRVSSNGFDALECTLYSLDMDGNIVDLNSDATTSDIPVSLDLDVATSVANGYYAVTCDVPPFGRVYGYKLKEY